MRGAEKSGTATGSMIVFYSGCYGLIKRLIAA